MPPFLYLFLGAMAIVSALGVVVQRNPIHSLLSLISTLLIIAIFFIAEDAVVVGFLQIIVYAGAIMVLFLFVIWLLNLQAEIGPTGHIVLKIVGSLGAAGLATELFLFVAAPHFKVKMVHEPPGYGSLASLAGMLFTDYLVSFEVTSVLLLAAVVGSVALARRIPTAAGEGSSDPRAAGEFRDAAAAQLIRDAAAASNRVQG
jgi:NADH-quinone oxidoreductase subunit J